MIKKLDKKQKYILLGSFILLFLVHLPLMTKTIISADILINNSYYNGFSWELSLGRFGLFFIGILKSFISIPHVDLLISYILVSISIYYLLLLFEIKEKIPTILTILFITIHPIISAHLLFHYCSIGYLIAFLCSIISIYYYYHTKNTIIKYLLPIICISISLSMYQAYLSFITTLWAIYQIKQLLEKKYNGKESLKYLLLILSGVVLYFIGMKLSQFVFHVELSSYSNANGIGIKTLLSIPTKIIDSYRLFYQFYFTDIITKNSYFHNNIINFIILVFFIIKIILKGFQTQIKTKDYLMISLFILTLPIFLNSVIFVISEAKLQLLMSSSYLGIPILLFSLLDDKKEKIITCIIFGLLIRNYFVQVQATYLTLENTYNTYHTVLETAIQQNINQLDKKFMVMGRIPKKDSLYENIVKSNYGYVSDEDLFWDDYYLRKIEFERFTKEYFGLDLSFVEEDTYNVLVNEPRDEIIYEIDNTIIINMNSLNTKEKEN